MKTQPGTIALICMAVVVAGAFVFLLAAGVLGGGSGGNSKVPPDARDSNPNTTVSERQPAGGGSAQEPENTAHAGSAENHNVVTQPADSNPANDARVESQQPPNEAGMRPPALRAEANNDLTFHTTDAEDKLKIEVLARVYDPTTIEEVKAILNAPWTPESIDKLWAITWGGDLRYLPAQVYKLLAYAEANTKDAHVADKIIEHFDALVDEVKAKRTAGVLDGKIEALLLGALDEAIVEYGDKRFLTERYWSTLEDYPRNRLSLVKRFFDQATLDRLKEFEKACHWDETRMTHLRDDINTWQAVLDNPRLRELPAGMWVGVLSGMRGANNFPGGSQGYLEKRIADYKRQQEEKAAKEGSDPGQTPSAPGP